MTFKALELGELGKELNEEGERLKVANSDVKRMTLRAASDAAEWAALKEREAKGWAAKEKEVSSLKLLVERMTKEKSEAVSKC